MEDKDTHNQFANEDQTHMSQTGATCLRKHGELLNKTNRSKYEEALFNFIQGIILGHNVRTPPKLEDRDPLIDTVTFKQKLVEVTAHLIITIEELERYPTKDVSDAQKAIGNFQQALPSSAKSTGEIIVISGSILIGAAAGMVIGFLLGQVIGAAIQASGSPEVVLELMTKFWDTIQESGFWTSLGTQGLGMFIGSALGTATGTVLGGAACGALSNSCLAHSTFFKDRKEQVRFYGNAVKEEAEKLVPASEVKKVV